MSSSARDPEPSHRGPYLEAPVRAQGQVEREAVKSTINDFSIVVGGPVYDFLRRVGWLSADLPNATRRAAAFVGLTWVPLLLFSLMDGLAFGHKVQIPLLYDFSIYGRLVLGMPVLILAELVIDPAIRRSVNEFIDSGLVPDKELSAFREVLVDIQRLRDRPSTEIALIVLAFFPVFLLQSEWMGGVVTSWHTTPQGITTAGWWFLSISAPLLRFITIRWGYRYFIWSLLLWRLGRLDLKLMPTHPDHAAGLEFLSLSQRRFGILLFALGCAFAGQMANEVIYERVSLVSLKFLVLGFLSLSLIVGLLPLLLLAPTLGNVRRMGLIEYGKVANSYTQSFDRKWVHTGEPASEPLLGTADIQSLADLSNSYGIIREMMIAPITKRLAIEIFIQAAAPILPVIILTTPTGTVIDAILRMVM